MSNVPEAVAHSQIETTQAQRRKLTILQVITPRRYSGAERAMTFLSGALVERGHRVVVACKHNKLLLEELEKRNVEAHAMLINGKLNLASPFILARFARRIGADVINTHLSTASLWGTIAGKIAGIPTIGDVQWLNHKHWYIFADHITTCSEGVRQHLIKQGMSGDNIEVVYNGYNTEQFENVPSRETVRKRLDIAPEQPTICTVAHLSRRKGHEYLLHAMKRLISEYPNLICLLLGEGDLDHTLRRMVKNLGLEDHVRFMGYRHDAIDIINAVDVAVLPSLKEGLGIVLIEAGFLGIPSVASDIEGIREVIVDGETGILVPPRDPQMLAENIGKLLSDPELIERLGKAARERMNEIFTLEAMADRAEEVFCRVVEEYEGDRE
ncbi:MAG: glycosyltransferase [Armatimonadota bacterium]